MRPKKKKKEEEEKTNNQTNTCTSDIKEKSTHAEI